MKNHTMASRPISATVCSVGRDCNILSTMPKFQVLFVDLIRREKVDLSKALVFGFYLIDSGEFEFKLEVFLDVTDCGSR